ncbi:MAG: tetratricopeptide repeat protein [Crocinitomicaceae bacterium]
MKKVFIYSMMIALTAASCKGEETEYSEQQEDYVVELDHDELLAEIDALETEINAAETPDEEKLKEAVTKFQDFANTFPDDERAPEFLLKASDFSNALKLPEKSVKILDRIIKDYPEYEKMEDIYYVRAVYLDFDLRDTTRAKEAYQTYIDKYPNSGQRVLDAQTRIDNIAYSIEELAEKFIQELEAQ